MHPRAPAPVGPQGAAGGQGRSLEALATAAATAPTGVATDQEPTPGNAELVGHPGGQQLPLVIAPTATTPTRGRDPGHDIGWGADPEGQGGGQRTGQIGPSPILDGHDHASAGGFIHPQGGQVIETDTASYGVHDQRVGW